MPRLPSVEQLNRLSPAEFADAAAALFEGAPRFLSRLAARRPFRSTADLFNAARTLAVEMPPDDQIELLAAHPRIGADPALVSALSHAEQGYDRATRQGDSDIASRLQELNQAYEDQFGFRFVVFVAGRSRSAIVPLLEAALSSARDAELARGLEDVVAIAEARLAKLSAADEPRPTIGA